MEGRPNFNIGPKLRPIAAELIGSISWNGSGYQTRGTPGRLRSNRPVSSNNFWLATLHAPPSPSPSDSLSLSTRGASHGGDLFDISASRYQFPVITIDNFNYRIYLNVSKFISILHAPPHLHHRHLSLSSTFVVLLVVDCLYTFQLQGITNFYLLPRLIQSWIWSVVEVK